MLDGMDGMGLSKQRIWYVVVLGGLVVCGVICIMRRSDPVGWCQRRKVVEAVKIVHTACMYARSWAIARSQLCEVEIALLAPKSNQWAVIMRSRRAGGVGGVVNQTNLLPLKTQLDKAHRLVFGSKGEVVEKRDLSFTVFVTRGGRVWQCRSVFPPYKPQRESVEEIIVTEHRCGSDFLWVFAQPCGGESISCRASD